MTMKYILMILALALGVSCQAPAEDPQPIDEYLIGTWYAYQPDRAIYDSLIFNEFEVRLWEDGYSDISFYQGADSRLSIDVLHDPVTYQYVDDHQWLLIDFVDNRGWERYYKVKDE